MTRLRHFLGFEDHTTPQAVENAEEILDSGNPDGYIEHTYKEAATAYEETTDEIATMEAFCSILDHGIQTGKTSPQFAAAVATMQERYQKTLSTEAFSLIPALENVDQTSPTSMLEYYRVSNEGFKDVITKLRTAWRNKRSGDVGIFEKGANKARQDRSNAVLSLVAKCRDDLTDDTVTVSVRGKAITGITTLGRVPKDIVKAAQDDSKHISDLFTKYIPEYRKFTDKVFKEAGGVFQNLGGLLQRPAPLNEQLMGIAKLSFPPNLLPASLLNGTGLLNNEHVQFTPPQYQEGNPTETLAAWNSAEVPRFMKLSIKPPQSTTVTLTRKQIEALLAVAEANAYMLKKASVDNLGIEKDLRVFNPGRLYDIYEKVPESSLSTADAKMLEHLGGFLLWNELFVTVVLSGAYRHIADVSEALVALCQQAVDAQQS